MATIRYLCIDDKPEEVTLPLRRLSRAAENLEIDCEPPRRMDHQVQRFRELVKRGRLDGVLLDLRLDDSAPAGEAPVEYQAQQLASILRTEMAAKKIEEFPIVLWSINQKFAKSFKRDLLSHDLFDLVVNKEELDDTKEITAHRLVSLASGYEVIAKTPRNSAFWLTVLRCPKNVELDARVGEPFTSNIRTSGVSLIARYILTKIVRSSGPLIDRETLCARLGIRVGSLEVTRIGHDLDEIARYKGPFHEGWGRWWWRSVENWWRERVVSPPSPLSITAEERVEKLKRVFRYGNGLRAAKPIAESYGKRFTTICQSLKQPLDPIDGFLISTPTLEAWEDRQYVSRMVALNPSKHGFKLPLAPQEQARTLSLRKMERHGKKKKK